MKPRLALLALLVIFVSTLSAAQGAIYSNVVLSQDSQGLLHSISNAPVTVCQEPASGLTTPCTPQVNTYTDVGLTQSQGPKFNTDSAGNILFYAPPGVYRIQLTVNGAITSIPNVTLTSPQSPLGIFQTIPFAPTMSFNSAVGGIFSVTLSGDVTSSTIANSVQGDVTTWQLCQDNVGNHIWNWPTSFLNPPLVPNTANSCLQALFYFDGVNWRNISSGGGGGGSGSSGLIIVSSNSGLPTATNTNMYMAGGFGGTTVGKIYVGDGSGLSALMSMRTGGIDTDLFKFADNGQFSTLTSGIGFQEYQSNGIGAAGRANYVRYTGNNNIAAVSENAGALRGLGRSLAPGNGLPIASFTTGNTDLTGTLTMVAGTATYSWTGTYTVHPNCWASNETNTSAAPKVTYTGVTSVTFTTAGATDVVDYGCIARN